MKRRVFLGAPALAAAAMGEDGPAPMVFAYGDGIPYTPAEYARLLESLSGKVESDDYSNGGVVERLEQRVAELLGKESACWMPTGTLANHVAARLLAGGRRRVLVQAESHLYNDCGDCAQTLSGLNLVPLAPGRATFTLAEAEQAANAAEMGRVMAPVGALQIESPVRRRMGERFDFAEMRRISEWARARKIGLHLDGARLFLESAYSGRAVREYAALFDTVYISMYKYFNAASGAVLAGPKALLDGLFHTRRMFGGGLHQAWPYAAVAFHTMEGFEARLRKAVETSEAVIPALTRHGSFEVERVKNGTNIFRLRVLGVNAPIYQLRLEQAGVTARLPAGGEWFNIQVNETWARVPAEQIVARFVTGLG
jgi:threonine aldolase